MRWRYLFVIFCFFSAYAVLFSKLYDIQVNRSADSRRRVESQYRLNGILSPLRGNIYFTDKYGNPINAGLNKDFSVIFAVPKEIQDIGGAKSAKDYAEKLSPVVGVPAEELEKKFGKKNDLYELLVQKASGEQVAQIKNLKLKGVYIEKEALRFYSFGKLASHILGFVSPPNDKEEIKYGGNNIPVGRYGAELAFNSSLSGEPGRIDENKIIEPKNGEDLFLTVDRDIQTRAEEILEKTVENWKADGGIIIVQEPATGKILALANKPDFDPNDYSKFGLKNFLNPAVQSVYEFGSVFKVITMAAGIDSGKITPRTTYVDNGFITLNGKTIKNWGDKTYGKLTMTEVIEQSVNTGSIFAEQKTGHSVFYEYVAKFGFDELTGVSLPGEVKGNINNIKNAKNARDVNFATASFGQGISVTAVSLINAFSVIANGGVLMRPLILNGEEPEVVRKVISEKTADAVAGMMVSAVEKNKVAIIANYSIAAKSGTAYIPDFEKGGYTDKVINTFAGFFPMKSGKKFTVLMALENPAGSPYANATVGPAFKELAQFIINYYNIPPDNL